MKKTYTKNWGSTKNIQKSPKTAPKFNDTNSDSQVTSPFQSFKNPAAPTSQPSPLGDASDWTPCWDFDPPRPLRPLPRPLRTKRAGGKLWPLWVEKILRVEFRKVFWRNPATQGFLWLRVRYCGKMLFKKQSKTTYRTHAWPYLISSTSESPNGCATSGPRSRLVALKNDVWEPSALSCRVWDEHIYAYETWLDQKTQRIYCWLANTHL